MHRSTNKHHQTDEIRHKKSILENWQVRGVKSTIDKVGYELKTDPRYYPLLKILQGKGFKKVTCK